MLHDMIRKFLFFIFKICELPLYKFFSSSFWEIGYWTLFCQNVIIFFLLAQVEGVKETKAPLLDPVFRPISGSVSRAVYRKGLHPDADPVASVYWHSWISISRLSECWIRIRMWNWRIHNTGYYVSQYLWGKKYSYKFRKFSAFFVSLYGTVDKYTNQIPWSGYAFIQVW